MEMAGNEGDRTTRVANPLNSQVHGGPSDSFALTSQPFDLRNWFSSYEYESPQCSGLPDYLGSYPLPEEEQEEKEGGEIDTQGHVLDSCLDAKFTGSVEKGEIDAQDHVLESFPDAKFIGLVEEEGEIDSQEHELLNGLAEEVGEIDTQEHPLDSSLNAKVIASVEEREIDNQQHPLESSPDAKVIDLVLEYEEKHPAKYDNVYDCGTNSDNSRTSGNLLMDVEQSSIRLPGTNDLEVQKKVSPLIFDEEVQGLGLEIKQDGLYSTISENDTQRISTNVAVASVSVENCNSCEHSKPKESIYLIPKVADETTEVMAMNENVGANGFISTKNSRNSWTEDGAFHTKLPSRLNCKNYEKQTRAKTLQENDQIKSGKRNALMDKTNVLEGEAGREIPGKWQCPRKNKPYMGPPLKQLRMEQWLHRVNKDHPIR